MHRVNIQFFENISGVPTEVVEDPPDTFLFTGAILAWLPDETGTANDIIVFCGSAEDGQEVLVTLNR